MFTPARYVIVDDNPDELKQLADCMRKIGAPCLPLIYDQAEGIATKHLGGVRLLFLDLHLTTGAQSGGIAQTAGLIVAMLEEGIVATSGPYVIILWTKHQEQKAAFEAYVMENLEAMKRPLAILSLDKNNYLAGDAGEKLTADVAQIIETDPRLRAMLDWEREVLRAAGATLSEIGALVAKEDRTAARFSERLDEILSLLAFEAVGSANAKVDPYSAVNAALMPILSDRIANQRVDPKSNAIWTAAVTKVENLNQPSQTESARLNSMLHIAKASTEALTSGAWGAVTLLPEAELLDEPMMKRFDLTAKPMLANTFCLTEKSERSASRLCLLRIGASCDYAQSRKGPVPFVLGAIIPADAKRRDGLPKAEIVTPSLIIDGFDGPVRMIFNTHLQISLVPTEFSAWSALCRLREPLLMQITTYGARHATRPAIISFGSHGG
ncbi:hypothetical protein [Agrobacterium radiobacter]|uniref:hypothetical protein n=1 Tax=Agrobacterium radiobacter TaxID=362 RepID=UPI003F8715FA